MKLSELAEITNAPYESSDGDIEITGAAGLEQAEPGQVTFLSNPRYTPKVAATAASAIFVGADVEVTRNDLAILRIKDPYLAFTRALIAFHPRSRNFIACRSTSSCRSSECPRRAASNWRA